MPDKDPLVSAWFGLDFQGQIVGAFRECSGLGSETQVVDHKECAPGGKVVIKKLPGNTTWTDIVLKQGVTDSMELWAWRKLVEEGKIQEARKNGSLVMFSHDGGEMARWNFINAWPSKLTGPSANATTNEVALEELTITHEGYTRVK